jgi:hypothetical protein
VQVLRGELPVAGSLEDRDDRLPGTGGSHGVRLRENENHCQPWRTRS